MTAPAIKGQCLCGAVQITVDGAHDPRPGVCHCRMCQRWTSGLFMCFEAQPDAVQVSGDVARYASSSFSERAFCPVCGSNLWMRDTGDETAAYELMPGLFEDSKGWPLRSEIYTDCAMAPLEGDHPRATRAQYEAKNKFVEGDA